MNKSQWQLALSLFEAARALPAGEQRAFVEAQSASSEVVLRVFELLDSPPEPDDSEAPVPVCHTGTQVGRYLVGELLGRGGMGEVYAARDQDLDRPVALKFLLPEEIGDPSAVKRFVREAKAASALNHPNILTVHEIIQTPSNLAIAMERVEGALLSDFRGKAHPLQQAVDLVRQVAFALAAAHEGGIVHRDIKPENLMLRPDGLVKVLDFGLAHRLAGPSVSAATVSGRVPGGTLRYMSPEQLRDEPVAGASDIFSLGIVLYEFAGATPVRVHVRLGDGLCHPLAEACAAIEGEPSGTGVARPPDPFHARAGFRVASLRAGRGGPTGAPDRARPHSSAPQVAVSGSCHSGRARFGGRGLRIALEDRVPGGSDSERPVRPDRNGRAGTLPGFLAGRETACICERHGDGNRTST